MNKQLLDSWTVEITGCPSRRAIVDHFLSECSDITLDSLKDINTAALRGAYAAGQRDMIYRILVSPSKQKANKPTSTVDFI